MPQFAVSAQRFDPYKNFKFRVKWDGRYVAGVSEISVQQVLSGISPALSALEWLVQEGGKKSVWEYLGLWQSSRPVTLFVWGAQRILPVRVLRTTVQEQMFDAALNPVRASIEVMLESLSESAVKGNRWAKAIMDACWSRKESLARQAGLLRSLDDLLKE